MFTKTIIEKADKLEQEALYDTTQPMAKRCKKAFVSGFIRGSVDGLVVLGAATLVIGYTSIIIGTKESKGE